MNHFDTVVKTELRIKQLINTDKVAMIASDAIFKKYNKYKCKVNGNLLFIYFTANIFDVIFTVFKCVLLSTVVSLYGLHLIAAPSTAE